MNHYDVLRIEKDEIALAIAWAAKEGWNPGPHDAACFYQADPRGFFAGKLQGKIIAMGSAVNYDDEFAFCGLYIVDKHYRGQGYGLELTRQRLAYVGSRNAGIDGVINMLDKYKRLGYKLAHNNARYQGKNLIPTLSANDAIIPLTQLDFGDLQRYDRRHFPAPRDAFLSCWIKQAGGLSLGYLYENHLAGYGVIRPCQEGYKIGPLFADSPDIAHELFLNLANHANGAAVFIDIPENNANARALVNKHQLQKGFETARMYLKGEPNIETEHIYGITTFELG